MAGRIPQSFIDDLMARVDIVEVIDHRVPLKKAGRDLQACCPFHNEKTPSFTVSPAKQFYHCFGCGAHGTAISFLMDYEHMEFVEAVEELARQAGLTVPRESGPGEQERKNVTEPLYEILGEAARWYQIQLREHPAATQAVTYLKERGLSGEVARTWGIGFAPPGWDSLMHAIGKSTDHHALLGRAGLLIEKDGGGYYDRFRNRIMFPILDRRGRVVGFGGRALGDDTPKYLNSPETPLFHKGRELYGLFQARKHAGRPARLLVVEGYMDVVALAQFGIHYAVATLGTATTRDHLELLYRATPEIVFCFDGDAAGRRAAWRALETTLDALRDGREARFLFLPEGEDPDSLVRKEGREGFEARLKEAAPLSDFFYRTLLEQADTRTMEGKTRLVELARPLLSKLPSGVFRRLMTGRLSELAGTRIEGLAGAEVRPKLPRASGQASNPVRHAMSLLLHQPALSRVVEDLDRVAAIDIPGVPLLVELIGYARNRPEATLATLLEHWRDREEGRHLEKLAKAPVHTPEAGMEREFLDTLDLLETRYLDKRYAELEEKMQRDGHLDENEKKELKQLVAVRHRPSA